MVITVHSFKYTFLHNVFVDILQNQNTPKKEANGIKDLK